MKTFQQREMNYPILSGIGKVLELDRLMAVGIAEIRMKKLLKQRRTGPFKIGRRQFLATTVTAAVLTSFGARFAGAQATTPKKGGDLRLGVTGGSSTNTLDPATGTDFFEFVSGWSLRNSLIEIDADGLAQPELAESWDLSSDATVWTIKLRKGVSFHNGKSMTADDVLWSINHHRGDKSTSAIKEIMDQIADVKRDDPNTIVVTLKSPNVDFPYILSDQHLTIGPAETDWSTGIGTGGYVIEQWDPGVRFLAKRNPNYWKPNRAHFDQVEIINVADVAARTSALLTGDIDACVFPDFKVLDHLREHPMLQVVESPSNGHVTFPMMTTAAPFNDVNVRLALKYAIDREEFVSKIFLGHASVGNDNPINETYRYFARDLPQRVYDRDKVQYHLKKAGLSGLKVDLSAAGTAFDGAVDAVVLYSEQAAKAGIDIRVGREPDDGYWDNVWMKKPFCASSWSGRSTVDWMLSIAYAKDAPWNESFWINDKFNDLLIKARGERSEPLRAEMYREMQLLIADDGGVILPAFMNYVIAASSKLQFGKVANNWNLDGFRLPERWWFKQ